MEAQIEELEELRDGYFEIHPTASENDREKAIREKALALTQEIPIGEFVLRSPAYYLLCGKIMNVCVGYEQWAEDALSRAVKLDCDQEAMIELGICLTKKNDYDYAIQVFEEVLCKTRDVRALVHLSVLLRSRKETGKESKQAAILERSLGLALEAVTVDPTHGPAHCCLGNAYLTRFFSTGLSDYSLMRNAIASYLLALSTGKEYRNPDLNLNLATALRYEENYGGALDALRRASKFDPSDVVGSQQRLSALEIYLEKTNEMVEKKGKLKTKRLQELCALLRSQWSILLKTSTVDANAEVKPWQVSEISELKEGANDHCFIRLAVLGTVTHMDCLPFTVVCCDTMKECVAVSVYNVTSAFGLLIGDQIVIAQPYLVIVKDLSVRDRPVTFRSLRVRNPWDLRINSQPIRKDLIAHTKLSGSP